jgi:peptidyl-Lys metalloendopeptidase
MSTTLEGKLIVEATDFNSAEPVRARFELTNHGDVDLYVLKWYTPLEGLNSDCLKVTRNGTEKVPYDGPKKKRGQPRPEDYVLVPAGGTVTAEVNVSESYAVSMPASYEIELNIQALERLPALERGPQGAGAALEASAAETQPVTGSGTGFEVRAGAGRVLTRGEAARQRSQPEASENEIAEALGAAELAVGPLPPIIDGGSGHQPMSVERAHENGFELVEGAIADLDNQAKYKKWFGTPTAARAERVKSVYTKIRSRMRRARFTYHVGGSECAPSDFAYTYDDAQEIWLCDLFFEAPAQGFSSKAGTLVHEHSHSDARTHDVEHGYGVENARRLASESPGQAVRNADNYEFFAES